MSPSAEGTVDPGTISEMFQWRLHWDPDREFLLVPDGRAWTFRDLAALTDNLSACLHHHGVRPGKVVGLYLWNEPAWFVSVLAVWRLGAIAALCRAVSPPNEAARRFHLVGPQVVIAGDAALARRQVAGDRGGYRPATWPREEGGRHRPGWLPTWSPTPGAGVRLFHGRHNGGGEGRREEPRSAGPGPPDDGRGVRTVRRFRARMAGPDKPPASLLTRSAMPPASDGWCSDCTSVARW